MWHGCQSSRSAFRPFDIPTRSRSNGQSVRFLYIDVEQFQAAASAPTNPICSGLRCIAFLLSSKPTVTIYFYFRFSFLLFFFRPNADTFYYTTERRRLSLHRHQHKLHTCMCDSLQSVFGIEVIKGDAVREASLYNVFGVFVEALWTSGACQSDCPSRTRPSLVSQYVRLVSLFFVLTTVMHCCCNVKAQQSVRCVCYSSFTCYINMLEISCTPSVLFICNELLLLLEREDEFVYCRFGCVVTFFNYEMMSVTNLNVSERRSLEFYHLEQCSSSCSSYSA